jgi:hypothetical protein
MDWPLVVIKAFLMLSIILVLRVLRVLWHAGRKRCCARDTYTSALLRPVGPTATPRPECRTAPGGGTAGG